MKKAICYICLMIIVFSIIGCQQVRTDDGLQTNESSKKDYITVIDARGREVTIHTPIKTYGVSTMDVVDFIIPFMKEEAFHMLVAAGQDGGHGLEAYQTLYTPLVGDYMSHVNQISEHNAPFDLEMILATAPDVLFINSAMGAHFHALDIEEKLNEADIPFVLIDVPGSDISTDSQDTISLISQVFQKESEAKEVIDFLDEQFAIVVDKKLHDRKNKPAVYYEMEVLGLTSTSAPGGWGHLVTFAGGDNIADEPLEGTEAYFSPSNTLDPEYIIKANPDVIILSAAGEEWMTNSVKNPSPRPNFNLINRVGWDSINAVNQKQIYVIAHGMERSIYSFNTCQYMAKVFYPDIFRNLDPEKRIDEFFDKFMLTDSNVTGWYYSIEK